MSIFGGLPLPWTAEAASKMNNSVKEIKVTEQEKAKAGKQLTEAEKERLKATLFKPIKKQTAAASSGPVPVSTPAAAEAPKKKLFGMF